MTKAGIILENKLFERFYSDKETGLQERGSECPEAAPCVRPRLQPDPSTEIFTFIHLLHPWNTTKSFTCKVSIVNGEEQSHCTEEEVRKLALLPAFSGQDLPFLKQATLSPNKCVYSIVLHLGTLPFILKCELQHPL